MKRSEEMVLVGYFLARCGNREGSDRPLPPPVLRTKEWSTAYACFYSSLGGGRPLSVFENSLKNARDLFDGHLDSGRVGWRDSGPGRAPLPLTSVARRVFSEWQPKSADALWNAARVYCDEAVPELPRSVLKDLEGELDDCADEIRCSSEGGVKYVLSPRRERNPSLRAKAFRLHGYRCQICTFDFGEFYGMWGYEFAEVHHRLPLGGGAPSKRTTNPKTDLVVLCANCHRMTHRKKGLSLTVDELRGKISVEGARSWCERLADAPPKAADKEPVAQEILRAKLNGQAAVAGLLGGSEVAELIVSLTEQLDDATDSVQLLGVEGAAAAAYWSLWVDVPLRFARRDQAPEHWQSFGRRNSPLGRKNTRNAVTFANAVLNYLYGGSDPVSSNRMHFGTKSPD